MAHSKTGNSLLGTSEANDTLSFWLCAGLFVYSMRIYLTAIEMLSQIQWSVINGYLGCFSPDNLAVDLYLPKSLQSLNF